MPGGVQSAEEYDEGESCLHSSHFRLICERVTDGFRFPFLPFSGEGEGEEEAGMEISESDITFDDFSKRLASSQYFFSISFVHL